MFKKVKYIYISLYITRYRYVISVYYIYIVINGYN